MNTVTPHLLYEDVESALSFLTRTFGFEETLRYNDPAGYVSHAEMRLGEAVIMLGDPGPDYRGPGRRGGATVQIHVQVDDVDSLYRRAQEAGAKITADLEDQSYGDRSFSADDPEGHAWTFGQTIREVAPEDWGAVAT
ncbi:VOC family protein [Rhodococcus sp. HNM0563]|uniref:VOC family protein n=1 Tax=unclassified Rhodococcus (in: high G+C Gram-positive bacteria) TaxID=192944 RepID=UPI00146E61EB|nr:MULTISPECIES: VOC family protein [unclassified Rhodococcus (in: high G+C Gram-positive bacteria)]MCK0092560.1 VOC family protein [Rhodococcus sp. F64268]NLU64326.1 VOC family protein [Rhodococcus sp. HNM0563]